MAAKDKVFYSKKTLNIGGNLTDLSRPKIMGILNITDDSFYDGGRYLLESSIANQAEKMISEGANIIDLGAYSSRPGASNIEPKLELDRILQGIKLIRSVSSNIPISIDTFRSEVAKASLDNGANMINDISGGEIDPQIFQVVKSYNVPYVLMHMRGTPRNMMDNLKYGNLLDELINYFAKKLDLLTHMA